MSCAVDNNTFVVIITPSRKRKRDSGKEEEITSSVSSGFTNSAFSSTPKKEIKSLIQKFNKVPLHKRPPLGKENANQYPADPCLEIKSISDLVNRNIGAVPENPFEVVRRPPKKKKKADIEEACFENPGLNLELPEKQFNPFEVKRDLPTTLVKADEPQCFINPALNIRTQETTAARNPFEIPRINQIAENTASGIENPGLDLASGPLTIGIPFKPTVGCRIDFNQMTPSKLLAEKLVFSPTNPKTPRVLSDVSGEDTTMDIGRELDRYQLELENSINEAKQKKTNIVDCRTFGEKLEDIVEDSQEEENEVESQEPKTPAGTTLISDLDKARSVLKLEDADTPPVQKIPDTLCSESQVAVTITSNEGTNKTFTKDVFRNESSTDDEGIEYDNSDDDEIDFKAPAPFIRAYRKADPPSLTIHRGSRESLKSEEAPIAAAESKFKVKNIIRNSIRKLMHPNKTTSSEEKMERKPFASSEHHTVMETIRHSFRRRPQKPVTESQSPKNQEISIIDTSERKMKFKSNLIQTDYIKIDELTPERKSSLRSSLRKSTRDVKNQILKTVFHKNKEEYAFAK